jgi:hypothetical protein
VLRMRLDQLAVEPACRTTACEVAFFGKFPRGKGRRSKLLKIPFYGRSADGG